MTRVTVIQSNYIPWKGYFDLLAAADEVVLLDEVQYTRQDWRNRNRVKTDAGLKWLTVPVTSKGRLNRGLRICDVRISDESWAARHWATITQSYRDAHAWGDVCEWLGELYERVARLERLSEVNRLFIDSICAYLGTAPRITWSTDHPHAERDVDATHRVVRLCEAVGADTYISGPAARDYLDTSAFERRGIAVAWADYSGYPAYPQPHGSFEHGVTILDLIACTGAAARSYLKALDADSGPLLKLEAETR
jgi:hypothetical protein